jgi:hypothetical protein
MRVSLVTVVSACIAAVVAIFLVSFSLSGAAKAQDSLERFVRAPHNSFSFRCDFRRSAPIDPIVHPGKYGISHQHLFFGGNVKKDSTYQQLRNDGTTCRKEFHKTGYWTPDLRRNGESVPVADAQTYYRSVKGTPTAALEPLPRGVKIIAGSAQSTGAQYGYVDWGCGLAPGTSGTDGRKDGFLSPVDCNPNSSNPYVKAVIHFPTCWTGAKDSADHKSHAAYPVGYPDDPAAWRCPEGYPIRTPRPDLSVRWRTSNGDNLRLSSGSIHSMHADIFEASSQREFQRLINQRL